MAESTQTIGRYRLVKKIGSGGMAEVFLARSRGAQGTEKLLVIKKIHPALSQNEKFIDMFVAEAHVAIRLNHTNIVQVYSFEHDQDAYILAMEYVDGTDLLKLENTVRSTGRRISFGLAAFIASEIAKGLDYAHSRCDENGESLDIVHRDVSPQNILISHAGSAKIADFGIARARWLNEDAGSIKGKFGYMSPEQADGQTVDLRTDIYALGIVLYEMLINRALFKFEQGDDPRGIICNTRHLPPNELDPSIPEALSDIVAKAVAHDPKDRYASAREMSRDLVRYLHSEKDIFDAQTLETFMAGFGEAIRIRLDESDSEPESGSLLSDAPTKIASTREQRPPTVQDVMIALEQRSAVAVLGRLEIEQHPSHDDISNKLLALIGEMAYKSNGVLRKTTFGFSIFLGLEQAAVEDAISGVRLAYDILDAANAVSRDHRIVLVLRLAVSQGTVHFQGASERARRVFEPDPNWMKGCEHLTESVADGEIVADSQVYKLARREYHFHRLRTEDSEIHEPGKSLEERSRLYRVNGTRSRKDRSESSLETGMFRERERELLILSEVFQKMLAGRPSIIRIVGEVGIGKTRFVNEFLKRMVADKADVLSVDCLFAERDRPMAAAADSIRAALGLAEGELGSNLNAKLDTLLAETPRYMARQEKFLRSFLSTPDALWGRNPKTRRSIVQRAAFALGVILALRAKERPLVLVVENAHWLDGPSTDVLSELAQEPMELPFLVLLVGNTGTLAGRKIVGMKDIELGEMKDSAIRRIILERLGTTDSMKSIADQIIRRAHGNPFFANEIVDSLIEQKIVVKSKSEGAPKYRQARPGTIRLPATMEGIAASRIAALPPTQRTVLRAASAVGASFDLDTVSALVGRNVSDDIRKLSDEGILLSIPSENDKSLFRFRQPMVREAAYGGLEEKDRKRLHRIIAKRLIDASSSEVIPEVRIAWHLELAGEKEESGRRYVSAANSARAIYSDRESLKLYDRAIPLLRPNSHEKFSALADREQVLRYLGRFAERESETREMKRIATLLNDDCLIAVALVRQAQLTYDLGDFDGAARILIEALENSKRSEDRTSQAEALRLMAFVAIQGGHLARAVDCADRALSVIKDTTDAAFLQKAHVLNVKGFALHQMGYLDDAATPLAESLVLFRRLGSHRNESEVMHHLAQLAWARGELVESVEFLERALRIDAKVRAARPRGLKLAAMGAVRIDLGDFDGAYANLADAKRICHENQERVGLAETELAFARLKIIESNYTEAFEILDSVGQRSVVLDSRILLVRHRRLMVMALIGEEKFESAVALADEATRIALESGMNGEAVHSGVLRGLALAYAGKRHEAVSATRRATDMVAMLRKVRNAEQVWWTQALTFKQLGDNYLAARAAAEAVAQVDKTRRRIRHRKYVETYDNHPLTQAIRKGL